MKVVVTCLVCCLFCVALALCGAPTADDTPALLAKIMSAGSGTVKLSGTYHLKTTLVVANLDHIALDGDGTAVFVCDVGSLGVGIRLVNASSCALRALTIKSTGADDTAAYELVQVGDNCPNFRCERVDFSWARHAGLRFVANNPGRKATIDHCDFHDIGIAPMTVQAGGGLEGTQPDMEVTGCTFVNCGNTNRFHGFYAYNARGLLALGNTFRGQWSDLSYVNNDPSEGRIIGNLFDGVSRTYIWGHAVTFSGNSLVSTTLDVAADFATVEANQWRMPTPQICLLCGFAGTKGVQVRGNSMQCSGAGPNVPAISLNNAGPGWNLGPNTYVGYATAVLLNSGSRHAVDADLWQPAGSNPTDAVRVTAGAGTHQITTRLLP